MPYIESKSDRRERLRNGEPALTAGELNYQIFYYVKHFQSSFEINPILIISIKRFVKQFLGEKPNYQKYNDMTGALIRCYKEIKRRLKFNLDFLWEIMSSYDYEIVNYEEIKIIENGDVE